MIIQKEKLMLVEMQDITLRNGTKKVKMTFLRPDNSLLTAYDPIAENTENSAYCEDVVDCDGKYNEELAKEFRFTPKEWQGKISLKLLPKA